MGLDPATAGRADELAFCYVEMHATERAGVLDCDATTDVRNPSAKAALTEQFRIFHPESASRQVTPIRDAAGT
jgi:hypothetical protein